MSTQGRKISGIMPLTTKTFPSSCSTSADSHQGQWMKQWTPWREKTSQSTCSTANLHPRRSLATPAVCSVETSLTWLKASKTLQEKTYSWRKLSKSKLNKTCSLRSWPTLWRLRSTQRRRFWRSLMLTSRKWTQRRTKSWNSSRKQLWKIWWLLNWPRLMPSRKSVQHRRQKLKQRLQKLQHRRQKMQHRRQKLKHRRQKMHHPRPKLHNRRLTLNHWQKT